MYLSPSPTIFSFLFKLLSILLLTACSTTKEPQIKEYFRTDIRQDNSKVFVFTIIPANTKKEERRASPPSSGGRDKRGRNQQNRPKAKTDKQSDKLMSLFQEKFENRLEHSQYCREGYFIIEKSFVGSIFTLKGECNESATDSDRERYFSHKQ